jgi:hypothetical protein
MYKLFYIYKKVLDIYIFIPNSSVYWNDFNKNKLETSTVSIRFLSYNIARLFLSLKDLGSTLKVSHDQAHVTRTKETKKKWQMSSKYDCAASMLLI